MIKVNVIFEYHLTFQQSPLVASLSKATGVLDLRIRFRTVRSRNVLHHLGSRAHLAVERTHEAWGIMAIHAWNEVVPRGGPCIIIRLHDVTAVAESGTGTVPRETQRGDGKQGDDKQKNYRPLPALATSRSVLTSVCGILAGIVPIHGYPLAFLLDPDRDMW